MKKTLLLFLINTIVSLNAQILLTEDCSGLTVGNIGTDILGTNAGQGGWFTRTLAPLNGNANFQIVDAGGTYGNVIKITGYNAANVASPTPATTNSRFVYKEIATEWNNRDFGAEITEVEYDFFTGPATLSSNVMRVALYDGPTTGATTKVLAGILVTMNPFTIRGVGHYDPVANGSTGAVGAYSFGMGQSAANPPVFSEITLLENTWYKIGFSYNATTGEMKFKGAGMTRNSIQGAAAGSAVNNITLIATTGGTATAPNTASATGTFDNIVVRASTSDTLLGINNTEFLDSSISFAPNPTNNIVTVATANDIIIATISIADLNGRIVKLITNDQTSNINIDLQDVTAGIYFATLKTNQGNFVKKIIKN